MNCQWRDTRLGSLQTAIRSVNHEAFWNGRHISSLPGGYKPIIGRYLQDYCTLALQCSSYGFLCFFVISSLLLFVSNCLGVKGRFVCFCFVKTHIAAIDRGRRVGQAERIEFGSRWRVDEAQGR